MKIILLSKFYCDAKCFNYNHNYNQTLKSKFGYHEEIVKMLKMISFQDHTKFTCCILRKHCQTVSALMMDRSSLSYLACRAVMVSFVLRLQEML